ncbi:interferon gamma receptor 2 isoform X2 [Kryptolebias marmoratus]|uniref:interferon gamma receptor 2 isoform X2 n=1 Tax=Kryptolebias marmoratus TaxID=37003 RepID=UPI0007F87C0F|nr:interferon gamma receptor 2 isoform X2 [Kryptolebias marmoratus]
MDRRARMFSGSPRCFRDLFVVVLSVQALVRGNCEVVLVPAPPTRVLVNGSQLTWSPGSEDADVTYSVDYRRFGSNSWNAVPECRSTPLPSCSPVSFRLRYDCHELRVRAERAGLKSEPVQACSSHGDLCSPQVHLKAGPGSLTVGLSNNHSLFQEYAAHAKHRVYYGEEGEQLERHEDSESSAFFKGLDVGRRFCVQVQFLKYEKPFGRASCVQCDIIPPSGESTQKVLIVAVVVIVLVVLIVGIFYIFICKYKKIKQLLRPPCSIPEVHTHTHTHT